MNLDTSSLASQTTIRGRLSFLLKDTALYGGATAVSRLLSIFTVPILARIFSKAEFGLMDSIAVLGAVFVPLMTMGQDTAVARFFYEAESDRERREVISQSLAFEFALIVLCMVPLYLFSDSLVGLFSSSAAAAHAFRILVLSLPFQVLLDFGQNLLKWTFDRHRFLFVALGSTTAAVALTILFTVVLKQGVLGVFEAQLVSRVVFAVVAAIFCRRWFVRPSHAQYLVPMLKFGWPYMLLGVSTCFMPMMERGFIVNRLGLEDMGIYAAAAKLAVAVSIPIQGFQTAWGPFAFALYKDPKAHRTYDAVLLCYTAVLCLCAYMLVAFAHPLLLVLVSSKYLVSQPLVLPLVFSLIVESLSWITGIGIDISKKTHAAVVSYLVGVVVTLAGIWVLVGHFGSVGVAYGMICGRLALTITKSKLAHRLYPIGFNFAQPAMLLAAAFALGLLTDRVFPLSLSFLSLGLRLVCIAGLSMLALDLLNRSKREAAAIQRGGCG